MKPSDFIHTEDTAAPRPTAPPSSVQSVERSWGKQLRAKTLQEEGKRMLDEAKQEVERMILNEKMK